MVRLPFLPVGESGMVMMLPLSEVVMLQKVVRVWVGNWCWEHEDEDRRIVPGLTSKSRVVSGICY
jgi:hypothetical protein